MLYMKHETRLGERTNIIRDWLLPMMMAVLIVMLIRTFVFDVNVVRGTSMNESLSSGDIMIARKFGLDRIERGDIVTVVGVMDEGLIVKRVIGLPGETVHIDSNGIVYINGEMLPDGYQEETPGLLSEYPDVILGDDEFYLMGDNRMNSYDSRFFGPVKRKNIRDVAVMRVYPFETY